MRFMIETLLALAAGLLGGVLLGWLFASRSALKERTQAADRLLQSERLLAAKEAQLEAERQAQGEKLKLLEEARERMKLEFSQIANALFEEKGKRFGEENEKRMESFLKPFREQVTLFEKRVRESYENEARERFSLAKEIGQLKNLNERLSEDARNLTHALKGQSKTQGIWGEMVLERLLEDSGLTKGREYETQASFRAEEGLFRPDAIVHLPEGKDVVIDAKVSLVAYERYMSAEEDKNRQEALAAHAASVRAHVAGLSKKGYENLPGIKTLDFVVLFIPVEGAFLLALQADAGLFKNAYEKGVLLTGPSTLLLTLRIIENIWRREDQSRNAQEIAQKAGDLYDKFVSFAEDLQKIGSDIDRARATYDQAWNRFSGGRGNLVRRAQELKTLGVKSKKELSSVTSVTDEP